MMHHSAFGKNCTEFASLGVWLSQAACSFAVILKLEYDETRLHREKTLIGQTLAHYEVVRPLGKGGMGEVYVAEDTKLGRRVALKVLPEEMAADPERRARFEREARAVAALSHPNIVTVHSVEEADGVHFITMELVEGKTLAKILPKNGFALSELLRPRQAARADGRR